tara:strand:+ start:443 stop:613 length:171 start_codon:yes stop_codon:yes gene_type:complete
MKSDLKTFNYFVDDLLSSNENLLTYELDILLMQYLFNSIDLDPLKELESQEDIMIA